MGFRGDIGAMGKLAENLGRLASVPSRAAAGAAENLQDTIQEQFDAQTDPYGASWAPHAASTEKRWGEHPILDLTGDMRGSIDVSPMQGAGISVTIDDPGGFHQAGTANMPARPILPENEFPETWDAAIRDALDETFGRTLEGG